MTRALFLAALAVPIATAAIPFEHAQLLATPDTEFAVKIFAEECQRRSGINLLANRSGSPNVRFTTGSLIPDAFQIRTIHNADGSDSLDVTAADARAALYAVGYLLRKLDWRASQLELTGPLNVSTSPQYPLRGHQLGYRATANSWDAWTVPQFEQYIRDLTLFGVNAIENIPFQDERTNPLMRVPRPEMNRAMSAICQRYGIEYWIWLPADFDLKDETKRAAFLARYEQFLKDTPSLAGIFVPGGDPGSNPPELVLPFLADLARLSASTHPQAKVWLSLQGFNKAKADAVYRWIDAGAPAWFGGIVVGPSSPSLAETRRRLPAHLGVRLYPDLTHNKISQFEVPQWDQAYALTLGREAINPRAAEYTRIFHRLAPLSNGFLSYSDGIHDDVNKNIWSALAWDPNQQPRDILIECARLHFGHGQAERIADAILALERNWRGPLVNNGAVESTLDTWRALDGQFPALAGNWRWQMCLLRANYDAYVRRRLLQANALEQRANGILTLAHLLGSEQAMNAARAVLETPRVAADLRANIFALCQRLFDSIGLQTSVEKYHASGAERGAVLDFVDHPLNNQWWLEDEFAKVRKLPDEAAKLARLKELGQWETPVRGSFYDAVGILSKAPHLLPQEEDEEASPLFWWWDQGKSRARLSWQATRWPKALVYDGLDPKTSYVVRTSGYGQSLLRINGERATATINGKEMGEFKEFPVPPAALRDGKLTLTWDIPTDEGHLNWRQHSRLAEVWLIPR